MIIILDACTVINLLLIDEDDYLIRCLDCFNKKITEKVFKEISINLKKIQSQESEALKLESLEEVERKLGQVRSWQELNVDVSDGDKQFSKMFNYLKQNGEFYSSILALRLKISEGSKVIFYTDDYGAKEHFKDFYNWHQIGYIEDTVDLLMLIYTVFTDFEYRNRSFERFLNRIRSRYAPKVTALTNELRTCKNTLEQQKIRKVGSLLDKLINDLEQYNFENIENSRNDLLSKDRILFNKIFREYESVFESQNAQGQILQKINHVKVRFSKEKPHQMTK